MYIKITGFDHLNLTYLLQVEEGRHSKVNFEGGNWSDHNVQTSVGVVVAACSFQTGMQNHMKAT